MLFRSLFVAGIVHVSSVLLLPVVASQNSFTRLSAMMPDGTGFHVLPAPRPGDTSLPFSDPGLITAACRFTLGASPWRVRIDIDGEALTSLSFYSRSGLVFHTLTDRAALRGRLDVLLGTAAQIDAAEAADTDDAPANEVRLLSPSRDGIVLVRAMAPSPTGDEAVKARIVRADCRAE